jgi:hypothetical protein
MIVGLVSNWGQQICGVAQFGRNWETALQHMGHAVVRLEWGQWDFSRGPICINWDSGTLPHEAVPPGSLVYVHHWYRGEPRGLDQAIVCSPVDHPNVYHLPYPVPPLAQYTFIRPKTLGVTTLRKQGLDYLFEAGAIAGWTIEEPHGWKETDDEVERLSHCHAVALWYSDSPGRSLALATALAARRPLILSRCPRMFAYAFEDPAIYWADFAYSPHPIVPLLRQIEAEGSFVRRPYELAVRWTWPDFIHRLEVLWSRSSPC